jgi:hypothetical protein
LNDQFQNSRQLREVPRGITEKLDAELNSGLVGIALCKEIQWQNKRSLNSRNNVKLKREAEGNHPCEIESEITAKSPASALNLQAWHSIQRTGYKER